MLKSFLHENGDLVTSVVVAKIPAIELGTPNAVAYCTYFAYQSTIKVGYTIFWKNSSPTHGTYEGQVWHHVMSQRIEDCTNNDKCDDVDENEI